LPSAWDANPKKQFMNAFAIKSVSIREIHG
jgi:hypothetical protein